MGRERVCTGGGYELVRCLNWCRVVCNVERSVLRRSYKGVCAVGVFRAVVGNFKLGVNLGLWRKHLYCMGYGSNLSWRV